MGAREHPSSDTSPFLPHATEEEGRVGQLGYSNLKSNSADSKERSVPLSIALLNVTLSEYKFTEHLAWPSRNLLRGKFYRKIVNSYR